MSWFPTPPGGVATFYRILLDLTEPVLAPLRRVIPPAGMFDLSFTVLLIFLFIVQRRSAAERRSRTGRESRW